MGRAFALSLAILGTLLVATPPASAGPLERGYVGRACGFDMNRNGIIGEAADCNVCDGTTSDPDGDGTAEDLIYVDCGSGNDSSSCGSPGSPCRSLSHAINNRSDGNGDGAEDIICFTGVCKNEQHVRLPSGRTTKYTRQASGNEVRDFEYPRDPAMIVGWDKDNDGNYPPFDSDDTSVLDGATNRLDRAFSVTDVLGTGYFEMGHFEVRGYGTTTSANKSIGFMTLAHGADHFYVHDLAMDDINRDKAKCSNVQTFNSLAGGDTYQYVAIENIDCDQCGGYFVRGGQGKGPTVQGPLRIKNVTFTVHPCDDGACTDNGCPGLSELSLPAADLIKMWGMIDGIEILDNIMDGNLGAWKASNRSNVIGIVPNVCSRDWDIINNALIDVRVGLSIEPDDGGFCSGAQPSERTIDDINFSRNYVRYTNAASEYSETGRIPIQVQSGKDKSFETVTNARFANNFISSAVGYKACFWSYTGYEKSCGSHGGQIQFVNNTCDGDISSSSYAAIMIGKPEGNNNFPTCAHDNYVIRNNLISGTNGSRNARFTYAPSSLVMDNNRYSDKGTYTWRNGNVTESLSSWQSQSGEDANSVECVPSYVNKSVGDLHLTTGDSCARNQGASIPSLVGIDIDDGVRPADGSWDVGADEVGSEGEGGGGVPPDTGGGGGTDPPPDGGGGTDPPPDGGGGTDPPPDGGGGTPPPSPGPSAPQLQEAVPLAN